MKINYRFGLFSDDFPFIFALAFLLFGGFEWVDSVTRSITQKTMHMTLVFFTMVFFGSNLLSIPFSYCRTFVI